MIGYIDQLTGRVDRALLAGWNPSGGILEASVHYALSVRGKRLRPLLFLTLLEAYAVDIEPYMDIACAIECIHTYSLIHDDLPAMDNDDFRRGMPTVHKQFNEAIGLLAGDTLLTYAFEKIAHSSATPGQIVNILRILTRCIGKDGMAGGQALDLEFNGDKKAIFKIHRMKTAELISACFLTAAEIIGLDTGKKEWLREAGISIGVAFQMADDLLDIIGDEKEVGKKLNKDQDNKSPNCIIFYGESFIKKEIDSAYKQTLNLLTCLNIQHPPFLYLIKKMAYRSK